jgi:hypothetical protein
VWDEVSKVALMYKDWGLLSMSVIASSVALSMGIGWKKVFRRVIFSTVTSLVLASMCYYGLKWEFSISFACGYFGSFFVESAFRQRLDTMGHALGEKVSEVIKNLPLNKGSEDKDD